MSEREYCRYCDEKISDADPCPHHGATGTDVNAVLNEAADEVLDWVGAPDTGARDIVNLVVNVFGERIKGSTADVDEIIESNYEATPGEVYGWCGALCWSEG